MEKTPRKYSFDSRENDIFAVECRDLDDFLSEIEGVCVKYGVGFYYDADEYYPSVVLAPISAVTDFSFLADRLVSYRGGVRFLDAAKREYERRKEDHRIQEEERKSAISELTSKQAEDDFSARLISEGFLLAGKRYKLTPWEGE